YIKSGSGSPGVLFHNHAQFWGVIEAPTTAVLTDGSGSPHVDVWGSIAASSASPNAQFAFPYDDSLGSLLGTGRYEVANWREDARDVLEPASARETAARVAAGTLAKAVLAQLDVAVLSHVVQLGPVVSKAEDRPLPEDLETVDDSPVRCFDGDAEAAMVQEVKAAQAEGDSLGGIVEVLAYGVPVGLGSHVHWDR